MNTLENIPNTADTISVKDGKVDLKVKCAIVQKGDLHIAFIPSLKLTARSIKGEADLHAHLDKVLDTFFKHYNSTSKLIKELKRLGWSKEVTANDLTDKEGIFISPDSISVPHEILNDSTKFEDEHKKLKLQEQD